MTDHVWLLVHYREHAFDVLVEDIDLCHVIGLYESMFEESVKQNVYLPQYFTLFTNRPRTNRKLELVDDCDMMKMWEWNLGKDTIEIWVEETKTPGVVFKDAEENWNRRLKEKADKLKALEEERKRRAEEEDAEKQLMEQAQYTVAVEIPIFNTEDTTIDYMRVYNTAMADEIFPGNSQPQPTQNNLAPQTPPKQPHTSPQPLNQSQKTPKRKKITPKS